MLGAPPATTNKPLPDLFIFGWRNPLNKFLKKVLTNAGFWYKHNALNSQKTVAEIQNKYI